MTTLTRSFCKINSNAVLFTSPTSHTESPHLIIFDQNSAGIYHLLLYATCLALHFLTDLIP
jgi:hypothetical protein